MEDYYYTTDFWPAFLDHGLHIIYKNSDDSCLVISADIIPAHCGKIGSNSLLNNLKWCGHRNRLLKILSVYNICEFRGCTNLCKDHFKENSVEVFGIEFIAVTTLPIHFVA